MHKTQRHKIDIKIKQQSAADVCVCVCGSTGMEILSVYPKVYLKDLTPDVADVNAQSILWSSVQ